MHFSHFTLISSPPVALFSDFSPFNPAGETAWGALAAGWTHRTFDVKTADVTVELL